MSAIVSREVGTSSASRGKKATRSQFVIDHDVRTLRAVIDRQVALYSIFLWIMDETLHVGPRRIPNLLSPSTEAIPPPGSYGQPKAGSNAIPALPGNKPIVGDRRPAPSQSTPSTPHNPSPLGRLAPSPPPRLPPKVQPER